MAAKGLVRSQSYPKADENRSWSLAKSCDPKVNLDIDPSSEHSQAFEPTGVKYGHVENLESDSSHKNEEDYNIPKSLSRYYKFVAIVQGMSTILNFHTCHVLSTMAPTILNVEPFAGMISMILQLNVLCANVIIFFKNPLIPWIPVLSSFIQGCLFISLVLSILVTGNNGKIIYLVITGVSGLTSGLGDITSFALFVFGPINNLPFLGLGISLGALFSFTVSSILKNLVFVGDSRQNVYNTMLSVALVTALFNTMNSVNLMVYLRRSEIREHLSGLRLKDGIANAICSFRGFFKGVRYIWKFLLVDALGLINTLAFYPGIVPGAWKISVSEKVQIVGISQVGMTFGRVFAVFVKEKYQVRNINLIITILVMNFIPSVYFVIVARYPNNKLAYTYTSKIILSIIFSVTSSYCLTFGLKHVGEAIPRSLDKNTTLSTTMLFGVCRNLFRAIGSVIGHFMILFLFSD